MPERTSLGEGLMREHGLLERILLIYEEIETRLIDDDPQLQVLERAARVMKRYFHDSHEKIEETCVIPLVRGDKRLAQLARTLKAQHNAARGITDEILEIAGVGILESTLAANRLSDLIDAIVVMYRPHMAWEDTVLIPALQKELGAERYDELGKQFDEQERAAFGDDSFGRMLEEIQALEQTLEIHDLASFTPAEA